jgi:hypothetical protein
MRPQSHLRPLAKSAVEMREGGNPRLGGFVSRETRALAEQAPRAGHAQFVWEYCPLSD